MTDYLSKGAPREGELEKINRYALSPLNEEEVYTFGVVLCDNEIDRDFERFSAEALTALAPMFEGRTGIFDHSGSAKDQSARIFECSCCEDPFRRTSAGENYACIKARAYMPKTEKNRNLIEEIESGIRKETSVGCSVNEKICSVCGEDIRRCSHIKGRFYDGKLCHAVLASPADAYEWSFVAVPAQKASGVTKSFDFSEKGEGGSFGELLSLASQGEKYRASLMRDCVVKCCELFPDIESAFFRELLARADADAIQRLNKSLRARGEGGISRPQFERKSGAQSDANNQFRI